MSVDAMRTRSHYYLAAMALFHPDCRTHLGWLGDWGNEVDAQSIALDNALATQYPLTGWRERQAAIWEQRADERLRESVAWA